MSGNAVKQDKGMENEPTIDSSSRANVQALLALFGQKDQPIMGILQPGCKLNSSSKLSLPCNGKSCDSNSNNNVVQNSGVELTKSSHLASQRKQSALNISICSDLHTADNSVSPNVPNTGKPLLKPKPIITQKPAKSLLSNLVRSKTYDILSDETKPCQNESLSSEETDCEIANAAELESRTIANSETQVCTCDTSEEQRNGLGNIGHTENSSPSLSLPVTKSVFDECSLVPDTSGHYIYKNNKHFKRKELPPEDKLGPAPLKPVRPLNVNLATLSIHKGSPPPLPDRTFKPSLQSTSNLPSKPSRAAPPPPPTSMQGISEKESNTSEEELYGDTETPVERKKRPVSLIPEYTEEEELGSRHSTDLEELYADGEADVPLLPPYPLPVRPNKPPPPIPGTSPEEEFYQDALEPDQEEVYEEMPTNLNLDEQETPLCSSKRDQEKLRKDEEKKIRKEQEKREKELTKLRKKYSLTGQEIPVDTGLVKADSRGGWYDLSVRKGETVLILRMENNPSGKWLVKNEKGKIGYVELTNIEVDADSVKSVMTLQRTSSQSISEELYSEVTAEEEAIYEETY